MADIAQGFTSYLAEGLQQLAVEGTIYVSEAVQRQTEGLFRFKDLGTCVLPEITQPMHLYECTGADSPGSRLEAFLRRHLSAFGGREREIDLLSTLWTRACAGQGQVVYVFGEAGMGKSRLAYELQCTLAEACTLQAQALSYGQTVPYHAFVPLLRALLRVSSNDAPLDQRQQIRTGLQAIHATLAEDEPLLSHLLGIPLDAEALPACRLRHGNGVCSTCVSSSSYHKPPSGP